MWCIQCRQDVPAFLSPDKDGLCCPRCGETISLGRPNVSASLPSYDGWEMDEQLRDIERVLETTTGRARKTSAAYDREASRFDLSHATPAAWHMPAPSHAPSKTTEKTERGSALGTFTWGILALGTAGFVCGGVLLGWSLATGRQELWTAGLPTALVGQVALLFGLVLQLDRLWHDNRAAAAKLDSVDEQLGEIKATTTLLGTAQGPAASTFYSHLASGAGPQLLLTDLKSQIDLLAMRIAQDER
jgi:hypothetical protein